MFRDIGACRIALVAFATVAGALPSAAANRCYWVNRVPYCEVGCWITRRWWDGHREWISYHCLSPELVLVGAGVVLIIIIGIVGAILAAANNNAHAKDIARIADDIAKTNELTRRYEDLERETHAHVASMRRNVREGSQ